MSVNVARSSQTRLPPLARSSIKTKEEEWGVCSWNNGAKGRWLAETFSQSRRSRNFARSCIILRGKTFSDTRRARIPVVNFTLSVVVDHRAYCPKVMNCESVARRLLGPRPPFVNYQMKIYTRPRVQVCSIATDNRIKRRKCGPRERYSPIRVPTD